MTLVRQQSQRFTQNGPKPEKIAYGHVVVKMLYWGSESSVVRLVVAYRKARDNQGR